MAAEPLSLMEFVHALLADASLRGLFADDPRATLEAHGLGDLSPVDVHDALDLVQDNEITDFHRTPWDVDSEAFGHGGAAPDHLAWSDTGEPAGATWAWTGAGVEHLDAPSPDAGWTDDGYGNGHDLDLGPADDGGPDLFHHHG